MIGTKLAHYEINSHLGSGGMGDVYQATDTKAGPHCCDQIPFRCVQVAAPVKLSPDGQSLEARTPAALFPVRIAGGPLPGLSNQPVAADSQRFLVNLEVGEGASTGQI